jgi:hypothetical protein
VLCCRNEIKRVKPFADTIGSLQEPVSGVDGKSCPDSDSKFEGVNTPESSPNFIRGNARDRFDNGMMDSPDSKYIVFVNTAGS